MKFSDLFKLSIRMFKTRTSRTLLTILGMSVGISAILFLVSLGFGLQKTLLERITTSDSLLTLEINSPKSDSISLDNAALEKIKNIDGVADVSPSFQISSQGYMNELSANFNVLAVRPSYLRLGGYKIIEGNLLDDSAENEIVVSSSVAKVFGKEFSEIIGQEITFDFYVNGIEAGVSENSQNTKKQKIKSETRYKIAGVIEGEDNLVFINAKTLSNFNVQNFNDAKVKCRSDDAMGKVRDEILKSGLLVSSLSDTVKQAEQVFKVIQIILMLFGFIALVVSAIGMFNTMTIAMMERTEEIGIMKSIGASNAAVSLIFIMESTVMGFLGGLGGVFLGLAGGKIFNLGINLIASRLGGESMTLFYSPFWFVAVIIASGALVGFITGIVPARRGSNIDPLDALRYK